MRRCFSASSNSTAWAASSTRGCAPSGASTASLVSRRASGEALAMSSTTEWAAANRSRGSVTRLTSRAASASAAGRRRPVNSSSLARLSPTSSGSRWVAPAPARMPSRTSGWPKNARSEHTRMSQA